MRRRLASLAVLVILIGSTAPMSGCAGINRAFGITEQTSDPDKVAKYENAYNATMRPIVYAMVQGWIPVDLGDQIEVYRSAADKALDTMKADLAAGRPIDDGAGQRAFNAALNQLSIYEMRYKDGPSNDRGPDLRRPPADPAVGRPGTPGPSPVDPGRTPTD